MNKIGRYVLVSLIVVILTTCICALLSPQPMLGFNNIGTWVLDVMMVLLVILFLDRYELWVKEEVLLNDSMVLASSCLDAGIYKATCFVHGDSLAIFNIWPTDIEVNTMNVNWRTPCVCVGFYKSEIEPVLAEMIFTGNLPDRPHNFFSWVDRDGKGKKLMLHPANEHMIVL